MLVTGAALYVALSGVLVGLLASPAEADDEADEAADVEKTRPVPGNWRFRDDDRPIKAVVLAGSVGAWPKRPYAAQIERMCPRVEVKNISKTGLGAWPLKQHFRYQVLENRRLDLDDPEHPHWLISGVGVNSIAMPEATNHHMKNIFVLAHMAGMKVVALTVTPWGDDDDRRFRGVSGLEYFHATKKVADFVMGRLSAREALGAYARKRPAGVDGDWVALELPDVSVDLRDSPLRDSDAEPRDLDKMRELLKKDRDWQRSHRDLGEGARAATLEADAVTLSRLPQWYLRPELRSFDHIHPNTRGHDIISAVICPELPEDWGCTCKPVEDVDKPSTED